MATLHPLKTPVAGVAGYLSASATDLEVAELGITDKTRAIARCHTCRDGRLGVAWRRRSGVTMQDVPCPSCGGRLYQTTNSLAATFYVLTADYVAASAQAAKAARAAKQAERIAAGVAKLVKDLEPGDVIVGRGGPHRVVTVGARPATAKTRVALELAETVDNFKGSSTYVYELRLADEVAIGVDEPDEDGARWHWADLEPGEAMLRLAAKQAAQYRRFEAHALDRASTYGTRVAGEVRTQADHYAELAGEFEALAELLESAKVTA